MSSLNFIRGALLFGHFFSIFQYYNSRKKIFQLARDPESDHFSLEREYNRLKRLEYKILYGRNITKSQTAALNALRTLNLPEHVSRGLIIGRYINENGALTSQPRFEYLIIFMFITTVFLELVFILCLAQGLASSGQQWSTSLALPIILTTPLSLALFYYYKLFMQNILITSKRKIELKNIFESQKLIGITTLGKKPKVSTLN